MTLPFTGFVVPSGGSSSGGSGDVVGPASATDNAIARYDTTTGELLQDSAITVSDVAGGVVTLATTAGNALTIDVTEPAAANGASVAGAAAIVQAGDAVASLDTAGAAAGGTLTLRAGDAARNTSGNANGGDVVLDTGAGIGTGTAGQVIVPAGATVAPGLASASSTTSGFVLNSTINTITSGAVRLAVNSGGLTFSVRAFGNGSQDLVGFRSVVEANVAGSGAPNVLAATEIQSVMTNEGVTAENYHTLPTAVAGYQYTFVVQDSDGIRITAAAGDTIRPIAGTAASATGGFIRCATLGAFITLLAINATEWIAIGSAGVWTIDV